MIDVLLKPFKRMAVRSFHTKSIAGFYRIRIINQSGQVIWLAKNTIGDLHDIVPPGRSLEIRLPNSKRMEFFAYKASNDLSVTGLNYYAKKVFETEDIWVIQ